MAEAAGGEAPKPESPDTAFIDELRLTAGNEQLLAVYNRRDALARAIDSWTALAERINARWPLRHGNTRVRAAIDPHRN